MRLEGVLAAQRKGWLKGAAQQGSSCSHSCPISPHVQKPGPAPKGALLNKAHGLMLIFVGSAEVVFHVWRRDSTKKDFVGMFVKEGRFGGWGTVARWG